MRVFNPTPIPGDFDPRLVNILKGLNNYLIQVNNGMSKVEQGALPYSASQPSTTTVTDHGSLSGLVPSVDSGGVVLDYNDDHTQYLMIHGRVPGQQAFGSRETAWSSDAVSRLSLLAFNDPPTASTSTATRSAELLLTKDAIIRAANFQVFERSTSYGSGQGFQVATGAGYANVTNYGKLTVNGMSSGSGVLIDHNAGGLATIDLIIKKRASQSGDMLEFQDNTGAVMSYVRASDGAFVGPVVGDHGGLTGLADDDHTQYLLLAGRGTGQTIGDGTAPTGGNINCVALKTTTGTPVCFILDQGNSLNYTPSTTLLKGNARPTAASVNGLYELGSDLTGLTGSAGILTAVGVTTGGAVGWTSGTTSAFRALNLVANPTVSGTYVITTMTGAIFQCSPQETGTDAARIATYIGGRFIALGTSTPGTGAAATDIIAGVFEVASRVKTNTNSTGIQIKQGTSGFLAATTNFYGIDLQTVANSANVTNWTGLKMPAITSPTGLILGLDIATAKSRIASVRLGTGTPGAHFLEIEACTTTKATALFVTGAALTTAVAGAIEYVDPDLFFTIGGPARKAFVLDDGTRLTSGRVPYATTNGRLMDDGGFLFTAGTGLTLSALNIVTDTTTGLKLGTATNQKLGFWNTAPIVQPTTAVAAATFVANTSAIANDSATFDGYTIGQVVKALRNAGLLA